MIHISGFIDEISPDFDEQIRVAKELGMKYVCIRNCGKNIAEYDVSEFKTEIMPRLQNLKVSSLGSPIGKINYDDFEGFEIQLAQLENLCQIAKLVDCKYIRMFSFYVPNKSDEVKEIVYEKIQRFIEVAAKHRIVLLHENEKGIYGASPWTCLEMYEEFNSPYFKMAFDFANYVQDGFDSYEAFKLHEGKIEYVHIKDAKEINVLIGTGDGKIPEILAELLPNYDGFLTLEPHLALFEGLADLEKDDVKMLEMEEGFARTHATLVDMLEKLEVKNYD